METIRAEQREEPEPSEKVVPAPLSSLVQAHLGRASRFADGKTRNWTLFLFYRILKQAEVAADVERLKEFASANDAAAKKAALSAFLWSLADPALMNAGRVEQSLSDGVAGADAPSDLFYAWLAKLTNAKSSELENKLKQHLSDAHVPMPPLASESREASAAVAQDLFDQIAALDVPFGFLPGEQLPEQLRSIFWAVICLLTAPGQFPDLFREYGDDAGSAGLAALSEGLPGVCRYEFLRNFAPAHLAPYPTGILRSEEESAKPRKALAAEPSWDPVPINFTFTHAGLKALQLDPVTLASFPEAFRAGMAARAERLGDTGPSAPENWYGALGLESVHGYFTGGFLVGGKDKPAKASDWQRLRDEVRAFNDRTPGLGQLLRLLVNALFRLAGIEIMHIELGEDPFDVDQHGHVCRLPYRREHFGFRDGISQPFADLELHDPPPGGSTPDRNRSWSPVAPGEIYLNRADEDGIIPNQPIPSLLRDGSTFVVFRKLEQDVPRLRAFLSKQRPADKEAQRKLASQFMGRWPNGTPLVLSPDAPIDLGSDPGRLINDFLYAADDPDGANCPLGAHVRRTNPRDIGGTNDVRRHRILRRGIGYGGPLLPEGNLGDGNTRGLLFIAVNARIDLQFEVVQGNWINKGEFLGQAGLGRCPVTGVHYGRPEDAFLESGSVAPVTGLPRFVITRGGDYFFAPGLPALTAIARRCKFELPNERVPYRGYGMGDAKTPILFEADRLRGYAGAILSGLSPVVRVSLPSPNPHDPVSDRVVFVGRHHQVRRVLSTTTKVVDGKERIIYSIAPYQEAGRRISRGYDLIIGTEPGSPTEAKHERMHKLLNAAWVQLQRPGDLDGRLNGIIKRSIEATLRRTGPSKRIDLVHDLPSTAVYGIVKEIFGTPGPNWLTELAVALPFAHQHVGELHPEWLAAQKGTVGNAAAATMQIWSILLFADIVGNYDHQQELMALSLQAGSEFLTQLDMLLAEARSRPTAAPRTMLEAFVTLQSEYVPNPYSDPDVYYGDVRMLLMELAGSAVAIIPTAFGSIMNSLLDFGIDLSLLIPVLLRPPTYKPTDSTLQPGDGITRLIYETSRVNPVFHLLMRRCALSDDVNEGHVPPVNIKQGEWVAALLAAANVDGDAFEKPRIFSLSPFVRGPDRYLDQYLLFGATGRGRECWGKDRLALKVLGECVKAAGRLEGLRRVAGDGGKPQTLAGVNIGLNAHFASVLRDWRP